MYHNLPAVAEEDEEDEEDSIARDVVAHWRLRSVGMTADGI